MESGIGAARGGQLGATTRRRQDLASRGGEEEEVEGTEEGAHTGRRQHTEFTRGRRRCTGVVGGERQARLMSGEESDAWGWIRS
jgi:hypothetical protein